MIAIDDMLDDVESLLRGGTNIDLDQYMNVRAVARRLIDRIGVQVQADTLNDALAFLLDKRSV